MPTRYSLMQSNSIGSGYNVKECTHQPHSTTDKEIKDRPAGHLLSLCGAQGERRKNVNLGRQRRVNSSVEDTNPAGVRLCSAIMRQESQSLLCKLL